MADDADITQDRAEKEAATLRIFSRKPEVPKPTGHCLSCDMPLPDPMRWCDHDCLRDHQRAALRRA